MRSWNIRIPIRPMPTPRGRCVRQGTGIRVYMPKSYRIYKATLATYFPKLLLKGAVKVDILFIFRTSESWTQKEKKARLGTYHTFIPDKDNLEKGVLDAMKGIVFTDDAVVADGRIAKYWGMHDLIFIKITELGGE